MTKKAKTEPGSGPALPRQQRDMPCSIRASSLAVLVLISTAGAMLTACSDQMAPHGGTRDPVLLDHMYDPSKPARNPTAYH